MLVGGYDYDRGTFAGMYYHTVFTKLHCAVTLLQRPAWA